MACTGVWFSVPVSEEKWALGEKLQMERKDWPEARRDEINREMLVFERHLTIPGRKREVGDVGVARRETEEICLFLVKEEQS